MALARQVGLSIRMLRKRRGLTQAALAELIDRSDVALGAIERGVSAPSFETLERLSAALKVPPCALFHGACDSSSGTLKRARDLATLYDIVRGLGNRELELAVEILEAISKHRSREA